MLGFGRPVCDVVAAQQRAGVDLDLAETVAGPLEDRNHNGSSTVGVGLASSRSHLGACEASISVERAEPVQVLLEENRIESIASSEEARKARGSQLHGVSKLRLG